MFEVSNTEKGYVVEAYVIQDYNSLVGYWMPLRNFGERQGDARDFCLYDCPKLPDTHIRELIRRYDKAKIYRREKQGVYKLVTT